MDRKPVLYILLTLLLIVARAKLHNSMEPVRQPAPGEVGAEESPSLPQLQVYTYDFESDTTGWSLQSGVWARVPFGSGHAIRGIGHGFARLTEHSGETSAMKFRFRLEDLQSTLHANVYENLATGGERYLVAFKSDGIKISRQNGSSFQDLGLGFFAIAPKAVHEAWILVGGGSIDIFVDGEGVVGVDDPTPPPGYVSFETLDYSTVYIDDVEVTIGAETTPHPRAPRPPLSIPVGPDIPGYFVGGAHAGNINLSGNDTLTLSQGRYTVTAGNINLKDNARLIIRPDAVLVFQRGSSPLIHWGIDLKNAASLEVDAGNVLAPGGTLVRITAFDNSSIFIHDAKPWIHFINAGGSSTVTVIKSRLVTAIGGSIQLSGSAFVEVADSKVGALALGLPAGGSLTASGLKPGIYPSFDLQQDLSVSGIGYNLVMHNVEVIDDTLGEGPYERGWVLFVDENAALQLTNSTLRKLVLQMPASGSNFKIGNLELNQPTNFTLGSVNLNHVTVSGQWGFFIHGARQATFENCEGLWFFLYDTVNVTLRNSIMNEFDPRAYTGILAFDDSEWRSAGEIIENNDFLMVGTATLNDANLKRTLSWSQSTVTRRYPIYVFDADGSPVAGAVVNLTRGGNLVTGITGVDGKTTPDLRFTDQNYTQAWQLTTSAFSYPVSVDFFTTTPIILREVKVYLPVVPKP